MIVATIRKLVNMRRVHDATTVHSHKAILNLLDECAKAKGAKGGHPADVTITVYVGPMGKAQSVGFASAKTVLDDIWADCAEKAALAWRLPDPRGTIAKLAIRYRP